MNRYLKIGAGFATLAVVLVLVSQAQAGFVTSGNTVSGTLQDWVDLGGTGVQQQDKLWVYQGSTILAGTTPLTFTVQTLGNGTDIHTLAIGDINFAQTGATLNYSIQITTPNNGGLNDFVFLSATLDTATNGTGTQAVKNFFSGDALPFLTLTSTDGSAQTSPLNGKLTSLFIAESWTVGPAGDINQTFNTFTGGACVPEPLSVVVWALLVTCVGAVIGLRRRRQAA